MKICVLQLYTIALNDKRLTRYLNLAKENDARVVVLGEYILNSFFTDILTTPLSIVKEQSRLNTLQLEILAKQLNLTIIAPLVHFVRNKPYKVLAKFSPKKTEFVSQNALINYEHWDERGFFANALPSVLSVANKQVGKNAKMQPPEVMKFEIDGFRFAAICGFELHFDAIFREVCAYSPHCILLPTASTLGSNSRWESLSVMRAFTASCYLVRANRLGKAKFGEVESEFYGDSFLVSPNGEMMQSLEQNEGILICDLDKNEVEEARKRWRFDSNYS